MGLQGLQFNVLLKIVCGLSKSAYICAYKITNRELMNTRFMGTGNYGQIGNCVSEKAKLQGLVWEICGESFKEPVLVSEALERCKANYAIAKCPMVALTPDLCDKINKGDVTINDMKQNSFENRLATYRTDTDVPLGVVSKSYGIVQNKDAFGFIDMLCSGELADRDHSPVITNAGVLGYGERVFITAKFPRSIVLDNKGDDRVDMYIVFTNSHDGSGAVTGLITPIRVWCNNTLALAMHNNSGKITYRHTANVMKRLDLLNRENREFAYKSLNLFSVYEKSLKDNFEHLKNIKLADDDLKRILAEVYLTEKEYEVYKVTNEIKSPGISNDSRNIISRVRDCVVSGVGQNKEDNGTALALINGITTYYQNSRDYRSDMSKFKSLTEGEAKLKTQKAFELVIQLK